MERSHTLTGMILGVAVVLMPGAQACAQWGSAPVVTLTPTQQVEWDKRRAEGKAAAQAFQWAKARDAYQKAWAIKQDWKVAANLGRSELNLSKHRDAAEHLTYALREAPQSVATEAPEEWNDLREMLARARARVGALVINVEPAGAEVLVNGLPVGKAPLPGAVFVEPGLVVVEARAAGYALANASMKVAAGKEEPVRLVLVSSWKKSEAPSVKPSPNQRETRTGALDEVTTAGIALAGAAGLMGVGFGAAIPSYKPHHGDQIVRPCPDGGACKLGTDCVGGACSSLHACFSGNNLVQGGDESDVDCGGSCSTDCANGKACAGDADCQSGNCTGNTCQLAGPP